MEYVWGLRIILQNQRMQSKVYALSSSSLDFDKQSIYFI